MATKRPRRTRWSPQARDVVLSSFGLGAGAELAVAGWTERDWSRLARVADAHGVLGALYRCPVYSQIPDTEAAQVKAAYFAGLTHHLRMVEFLGRLGPAFEERKVRWVAIKGPVLAELAYPSADLRSYRDLDLLVHPHDFQVALELLETWGGEVLERNWTLARTEGRGEIGLSFPNDIFVDLHWHLLLDPALRKDFRVDTDTLLGRRGSADLGGVVVPVLDDVDALVHLAVHAALSGGHQLRWLIDVFFAAQRAARLCPEPIAIASRAEALGSGLTFEVMSRRASTWLGVPLATGRVPRRREVWASVLGALDSALARSEWLDGGHSGRLLVGTTRRSTRLSFRALRGSVRTEVQERFATWRGRNRTAPNRDPVLYREDPRPEGRGEFLEMVRSTLVAPG